VAHAFSNEMEIIDLGFLVSLVDSLILLVNGLIYLSIYWIIYWFIHLMMDHLQCVVVLYRERRIKSASDNQAEKVCIFYHFFPYLPLHQPQLTGRFRL